MSEKIVMTPKGKTSNSTTLIIERKAAEVSDPDADNVHVAGGDHKGIVINKTTVNGIDEIEAVPEISLQFRVFLVNGQTGSHTQESRKLLFWFKPSVPVHERPTVAQEFFKELVTPQHFPRDYVGFIKMLMKLMQNRYPTVRKLEVELKQLAITKLPERPVSSDESIMDNQLLLTAEKVLEIIEAAYPHPITVEELAKQYSWDQDLIRAQIEKLKDKKVVKAMDHGAYTRVIQHDKDVQIVKHMPTIIRSKQPTIAIITAQYCEKLAVDAMMENRETFVRYTTVGESNVYTLGNMGGHRVVCTKLPTIGYTREAMTSAGNTTTRLLGTFSKVDFVFLVGVGGGVPHYTDYTKHVRLGDVIVSSAAGPNTAAYTYCEHVKDAGDNEYVFEYKSHNPQVPSIQQVAASLLEQYNGTGDCPWYEYMAEGRAVLEGQNEHDFGRPSSETDKLYMSIGEKDVIEVNHPVAPDETDSSRLEGCPRLHLGPIACGQGVSRDARLREAFSRTSRALAFDFESDSVVESIVGNCRESWALVRGIADYKDGQRKGPWQPFASLAAAAVTKSIICGMEPPPE
ncbi:Conserved hypothetical protein [Nesidiocoris tenuis]|uniref:Nucleoside phosphorylase domain-containing protein n=1 Tax=Nesidiocoris tenuis TaxID=355587 RepID=A0ABN7B076_9HEMI|nr:Conserved hypothetical protein [Nesidiocoris tenuis]